MRNQSPPQGVERSPLLRFRIEANGKNLLARCDIVTDPFIPPDFRGVQYNYHFSAGIPECTLRAEESPGKLSVILRVGKHSKLW